MNNARLFIVLQCDDKIEDLLAHIQSIARGANAMILLHQELRDASESVACTLDLAQLSEFNVRLLSSLEEEIEQIQLIRQALNGNRLNVRMILSRGSLTDVVAYCIRESKLTCLTILTAAGCWFVSGPSSGNECEAIN